MRVRTEYGRCGGCGQQVLLDYYAIRAHSDKAHRGEGPSLEDFRAIFMGDRRAAAAAPAPK